MSAEDTNGRTERPGRESRPHLADYLAVLLRHKALFLAAFLVVLGGLTARALLDRPVYVSEAMLQIEEGGESGGLLGDLKALGGDSPTQTEMEIMRSRTVAQGAFSRLTPSDFLVEENAYRPLEMLLAALRGPRDPCEVTVETGGLGEGELTQVYAFTFRGREGESPELEARKVREGDARVPRDPENEFVGAFRPSRSFEVSGRSFALKVEGDPRGRTFLLALRPPRDAARWIQDHVRVHEVGLRTGVVSLAFEAPTPRMARRVAAAVTESYLHLKNEQRKTQVRQALEFLSEQKEGVGKRLKDAEGELDRFRADSGAVLLSDQAEWIVEKISSFQLEKADLTVRQEELKRLRATVSVEGGVETALQMLDGRSVDPMTLALSEQLARLELEREGLEEGGVLPDHPRRRRVEAELRAARSSLAASLDAGLGKRVEQLEFRAEHVDATIRTYEEEARKLPETERALAELTRDVRAQLRIFDFLVEKEQEAQLALVSTLASVRMVDAPWEPRYRSSPHLVLELGIALTVAFMVAILLAFFAEYLDRTLRSPQALEQGTGLSLFASIPDYRSVPGRGLRGLKGALVSLERPGSSVAEAYRTFRTNLRFAGLDRPVRSLAITSALPGEGKTVTICNLAVTCARMGERVLVVDADLRRPMTQSHFGMDRGPGLAEVLCNGGAWREVVRGTSVEGLSLLPAGSTPTDPGALLDSPVFRTLLKELKEEFDLVLLDGPPVLAVADPSAVLADVDAVFLLTRAKKCTLEVVVDARDQIRRVGGNLLGAVFNGFDARTTRSGRYGYYGTYSRYEDGAAGEGKGNGRSARRDRKSPARKAAEKLRS